MQIPSNIHILAHLGNIIFKSHGTLMPLFSVATLYLNRVAKYAAK